MNELLIKYEKEFLHNLKVKNYADATIYIYSNTFRLFHCFLEIAKVDENKIYSLNCIIEFKKYLDTYLTKYQTLLTSEGKRLILNNTRCFFQYLEQQNLILTNPFHKFDKTKVEQRLPKNILTETEINAILHQIDTTTKFGYRDRAMLELLYSAGVRRAELASLNLYDVDLNNGFVIINKGKGGKNRIIPIGDIACKFLEYYINAIRPKFFKDGIHDNGLFLTQFGKKISIGYVGGRVKQYILKAKLNPKYSTHSFRHACATEMLKGKANIRHVQEMLGHAFLSTTQIYTHIMPLDLLEVHKLTHPSWTLFDEPKQAQNEETNAAQNKEPEANENEQPDTAQNQDSETCE